MIHVDPLAYEGLNSPCSWLGLATVVWYKGGEGLSSISLVSHGYISKVVIKTLMGITSCRDLGYNLGNNLLRNIPFPKIGFSLPPFSGFISARLVLAPRLGSVVLSQSIFGCFYYY